MELPTNVAGWAWLIGFGGLGFLFVITLVVFVHELGHFLAARYFGVRVESFSIGFGRAIAGFKDKHGTQWKIGWLPLGGYVKFWGDEGVSSTPDHEKIDHASAEERAGSFHHKPLYQKAIIAVGGPVANFIFAVVVLTGLFYFHGDSAIPARIGALRDGDPAQKAGLQVGDTILSIGGAPVREFNDIVEIVSVSKGHLLAIRVLRDGQELTINVVPKTIKKIDPFFGTPVYDSGIGISPVNIGEVAAVQPGSPAAAAGLLADDVIIKIGDKPLDSFDDIATALRNQAGTPVMLKFLRPSDAAARRQLKEREARMEPRRIAFEGLNSDQVISQALGFEATVKGSPKAQVFLTFSLGEAFERGVSRLRFIVVKTLYYIAELLTLTGDYRQLSGIVGIAAVSSQVLVVLGVPALIYLAAVLSMSIGLLNLFPIPMLDGGHLLYYGIEAVRGRPLGERAQELGFRIGFVLVVSLMIFATWNDLTKFLS